MQIYFNNTFLCINSIYNIENLLHKFKGQLQNNLP
jgi:hypothetical protein